MKRRFSVFKVLFLMLVVISSQTHVFAKEVNKLEYKEYVNNGHFLKEETPEVYSFEEDTDGIVGEWFVQLPKNYGYGWNPVKIGNNKAVISSNNGNISTMQTNGDLQEARRSPTLKYNVQAHPNQEYVVKIKIGYFSGDGSYLVINNEDLREDINGFMGNEPNENRPIEDYNYNRIIKSDEDGIIPISIYMQHDEYKWTFSPFNITISEVSVLGSSETPDTPGDTEADTPGDTEADTPGDTEADTPGDLEVDTPQDTEIDRPESLPNLPEDIVKKPNKPVDPFKPIEGDKKDPSKESNSQTNEEEKKLNKEDHIIYIRGYEDNTVRPNSFISREEVAMVFYRLLDKDYLKEVYSTENNFNDIESTRWSNEAISTLAKAGIINGYEDGSFRPGDRISRAEVAVIASRFDRLEGGKNSFTDIDEHWAMDYIISAAEKGWVKGYEDGSFNPGKSITRAEFVSLVNGVLDRSIEKKNIPSNIRKFTDLDSSKWYYEDMVEASNEHIYERLANGTERWLEIIE